METSINIASTEIRKLASGYICQLVQILEQGNQWKELMFSIPQDCFNIENKNPKYTNEDMRLIEDASVQQRRPCSEILLEEWGTSGKRRPTVDILYLYLKKAELFRAADFVATKLLKEPIPERPKEGPARTIVPDDINISLKDTDSESASKSFEQSGFVCNENTVRCEDQQYYNTCVEVDCSNCMGNKLKMSEENNMNTMKKQSMIKNETVKRISYNVLKLSTDNFSEESKLGSGAFSSVFFGKVNGKSLAIKRLNIFDQEKNVLEHFKHELMILSHCNNHKNLLPLLAISDDDIPCLIYELMPNGSLEDRLFCKKLQKSPLNWRKRISIAYDITDGLKYLHTLDRPIIHCDIKTSNILLNSSDTAKIGDFGLVRVKNDMKTSVTSTVQGTNAYMAPEALRGVISPKADIFSFGIVLLELLTGLSAYDEDRDEKHLMYYIDEIITEDEDVENVLDKKAGLWHKEIVKDIYNLTKKCLKHDKKSRIDTVKLNIMMKELNQRVDALK